MKRNGITKDVLWLNISWMSNEFILEEWNLDEKCKNYYYLFTKYWYFILFFYFLAHYRPVEPSKQSFIYNAAGKWI